MNSEIVPGTILLDSFYLPSVALLRHLHSAKKLLINTEARFSKSGWHNRCKIAGPNGVLLLTVPVRGGRNIRKTLSEVYISYEERWQQVHWRSLCAAYRKSPYFEFYEDLFRPFYEQRFELLSELNFGLLRAILKALAYPDGLLQYGSASAILHAGMKESLRNPSPAAVQHPYYQVFQHRHGFLPGLSIIDLICNEGPAARAYLSADS